MFRTPIKLCSGFFQLIGFYIIQAQPAGEDYPFPAAIVNIIQITFNTPVIHQTGFNLRNGFFCNWIIHGENLIRSKKPKHAAINLFTASIFWYPAFWGEVVHDELADYMGHMGYPV